MRLGRRVVMGLAGMALVGCSRPGPSALPALPAALQTLYQRAKLEPSAAAWTAVARGEAARRHWPRAVAAYQAALRLKPDYFEALAELAGLRTAHGERDEATRLILAIEKHHAGKAAAQAVLGDLYGLLGRRELGLASYRRALALDPRQSVPLLRLGQEAFRRGRMAEARDYLDRLLAVAPSWPAAKAFQLELARAGGRLGEAERLLREAWESRPGSDTRALLSSFYLSNGRPAEALAVNEAWLRTHRSDIPAIVARAEALARLGREREARRGLQRLVDSGTLDPRVYLALGRLLFASRRNDEAVAMLREAKDRAPLDSSIQLEVADQFERHGLSQEALELYSRLADDDPRLRPDLAWRMAVIVQEAGARPGPQGDLVERYYRLALQANPNHVVSLNNLAFHYAEHGLNLATARQLIERAIALQGADPNLLDTRGWVALKQGDLPAAGKYLASALSKQPNDALTLYHWARLRQKLGDATGALAAARRALTLNPKFIGRDDCAALVESGGRAG